MGSSTFNFFWPDTDFEYVVYAHHADDSKEQTRYLYQLIVCYCHESIVGEVISGDLTGDWTRTQQSCSSRTSPSLSATLLVSSWVRVAVHSDSQLLTSMPCCRHNFSHLLSLISTIYLQLTRFTNYRPYFKYKLFQRYSLFSRNC